MQYARWYGADYTLVREDEEKGTEDVDLDQLIEAWDGCTYVEALGELVDVPGIGEVTQVMVVCSNVTTTNGCGGLSIGRCLFSMTA